GGLRPVAYRARLFRAAAGGLRDDHGVAGLRISAGGEGLVDVGVKAGGGSPCRVGQGDFGGVGGGGEERKDARRAPKVASVHGDTRMVPVLRGRSPGGPVVFISTR